MAMMGVDELFVDTNILVYATGILSPCQNVNSCDSSQRSSVAQRSKAPCYAVYRFPVR